MPRACVIVLDAVGVGDLPDAGSYGSAGSNTLAHVAEVGRNIGDYLAAESRGDIRRHEKLGVAELLDRDLFALQRAAAAHHARGAIDSGRSLQLRSLPARQRYLKRVGAVDRDLAFLKAAAGVVVREIEEARDRSSETHEALLSTTNSLCCDRT